MIPLPPCIKTLFICLTVSSVSKLQLVLYTPILHDTHFKLWPSLSFLAAFLQLQAIEFFFFAVCIGAVAILFALMSFFYKYVDLSTYKDTSSQSSSDETRALILSHEREKPDSYSDNVEDKGNESEF